MQPVEQILDEIEPRQALVVGAHQRPRRRRRMRARQHLVAGLAVGLPLLERLVVDRAGFPLLERIRLALRQAFLLLGLADVEVVLEEFHAGADQHVLELLDRAHELLVIGLAAKAHHPLDPGAVVPAAVEQHEFLGGRQMDGIALEIPRRAVGGFAEGDDAGFARAQVLDDALDRAVLAGRVAALEDDQDLVVALDEVPLQLDQFDLQFVQGLLVGPFR
ncbi:hypothetical protein D3C78_1156100 [compost metagenome]